MKEQEIKLVWLPGESGGQWEVGKVGVTRMYLAPTGNGLSGHYDQVHIFKANGEHIILNAHQTEAWVLREPAE